jgi:hypothetical protein
MNEALLKSEMLASETGIEGKDTNRPRKHPGGFEKAN